MPRQNHPGRRQLFVVLSFVFSCLFCCGQIGFASAEKLAKYGLTEGIHITLHQAELDLDAALTVEELAVLLTRINQLPFLNPPDAGLHYFKDAETLSPWAKPYLNTCVLNHMFAESGRGEVASKDAVTGEQLAVAMMASAGYDGIRQEDARLVLETFGIAVGNRPLTRKQAFDLIWKTLTKLVTPDGSCLIETAGIATIEQLELAGERIEDFVLKRDEQEIKEMVDRRNSALHPEISVMHGCGRFCGFQLSNTKDALLFHYERGKRMFEIDFCRTSDDEYIGLHGWKHLNGQFYRQSPYGKNYEGLPLSLQQFRDIGFDYVMEPLDLNLLQELVTEYPDLAIITDIKMDNLPFLRHLVRKFPALVPNVIPQVYSREEYTRVKELGFARIIYTLYRSTDTPQDVFAFIEAEQPYAITIPWEYLRHKAWRQLLNRPAAKSATGTNGTTGTAGITGAKSAAEAAPQPTKIFVHTVNSLLQSEFLLRLGVDGIYTDDL